MEPIELSLWPGGKKAARKALMPVEFEDDPYDVLEAREVAGMQELSLYEQIVRQCGNNVFQMHVRGKDGEFVPVPYRQIFDSEEIDYLADHGAEFGAPEEEPVFPHRPLYPNVRADVAHPIGEVFDVPISLAPVCPVPEDHADKSSPETFQVGGAEVAVSEADLAMMLPELPGTSRAVAVNMLETGDVKCDFSNGSINLKVEASYRTAPTEQMYSALAMLENSGIDFSPLRKNFDEMLVSAVFSRYELSVETGDLHARVRQSGSNDDPLWKVSAGPLAMLLSHIVSKCAGRRVQLSAAWTVSRALYEIDFTLKDLRACVEAALTLSRSPTITYLRVHVPDPSESVRHCARVLGRFLSLLPRVKRRSVAYIPRSARDFESMLVLCAAYGVQMERRSNPDCSRPIICATRGRGSSSNYDRLGIVAFSRLFSVEIIDGSFTRRFMPLYRYVRPKDVELGQYVRMHFSRTKLSVTSMCTIQRAFDGVERVVMSPERRSPDRYGPYVRLVCAYLSGNAPAPSQWSYYAYYRGADPRLELYPLLVAHADDFVSSEGVDAEAAPASGPPIATFVASDLTGRRPVPLPAIIGIAHV